LQTNKLLLKIDFRIALKDSDIAIST